MKQNNDEDDNFVPYVITPMRGGHKEVRRYELPFEDAVGNKATITYSDFLNRKGTLVEKYVLFVKWE